MKTFKLSNTLPLGVTLLVAMTRHSNALLMRNNNNIFTSQQPSFHSDLSNTLLAANNNSFEQLPGESDIDFINRITSQSKALLEESSSSAQEMEEEPEIKKPKGKYQPIEEWDEERKKKGELSWEERVQFEGQKHGNQLRQNDILIRNLHSF